MSLHDYRILRSVFILTRYPRALVLMVRHACNRLKSGEHNANRALAGYSMTLFQSLATSAGYDPVKGPGSSCTAADASGQCVLPWGNGTKAVSSIVLVSNGVSFAVCCTARPDCV